MEGSNMDGDSYLVQLEQSNDRELVAQRAKADSMRLVATFSSAVAATVVAPGLQAMGDSPTIWWSTILLLASVLAAISLIIFDRITAPDIDDVLVRSSHARWDALRTHQEIRLATINAVIENRKVLQTLRSLLYFQSLAALAAIILSAIALIYIAPDGLTS